VRDVIESLVRAVDPWDPLEYDHRADVLAWIGSNEQIFRTAEPATPPKHLVSYSVLVDSERSTVLLVDHRDAQRWLPTGGHVNVDEHPADVARREILEELQLDPPCSVRTFSRAIALLSVQTRDGVRAKMSRAFT
jgi:8-oxo-dGTP diphosphatase